ncbi:Fructose/tagatose bisphosphate aldolase [Vibrio mediterranei AK1]|uniref:class II fructose-bisphosphate aldolase n=1 Tax=Vibrio mediterranei TaxID=689 RepID=UPI000154152F|nr:class II fructose-bisphosphate aldolase [Vibrio mediterranei]EDL53580.1 Fructose/tagatose bisphosphate aldolase [Vibrio mediterranei AK1]
MLVSTKKMLMDAREGGYAVPSANFIDYEMAKTFVDIAEQKQMPLILSFAECHMDLLTLEEAANIAIFLASKASVDIALHLDHGMNFDVIKKAIECGFTSVMVDASAEKFDRNVTLTKQVVEYAHKHNVPVEAEIGHVGAGENFEDHEHNDSVYTDVQEAIRFANLSGADSLAISIGTAHGTYSGVPKISFERLKEIRASVAIPLVLHGGSSTGDENLSTCASLGISKINIFTDFIIAALSAANEKQYSDYFSMKREINERVGETLSHYYSVYGTKTND